MNNQKEYNTWLLKVNLDNIQENYTRLTKEVSFLLLDSDYAILRQLELNYTYNDNIDFGNVDIEDIKEYLQDFNDTYIESI